MWAYSLVDVRDHPLTLTAPCPRLGPPWVVAVHSTITPLHWRHLHNRETDRRGGRAASAYAGEQTLSVQCTDSPFWAPCSVITTGCKASRETAESD
jgi:hypothetical protein